MFILLHFNNNLITIFIYDLQELLNPLKVESLLGKRNDSGLRDQLSNLSELPLKYEDTIRTPF